MGQNKHHLSLQVSQDYDNNLKKNFKSERASNLIKHNF